MKFFLTNGVFHREKTITRDITGKYIQYYPDEGISYEIPDNIEKLIVPDGTRCIGVQAFRGVDHKFHEFPYTATLKEIVLPDSVVEIENEAFARTPTLSYVHLSNGLKRIGIEAFRQSAIERIVIPESVEVIEGSCFYGCQALTDIVLPKSYTKIDISVFLYCSALKRLVVPGYIKELFYFTGCISLEEIVLSHDDFTGGFFCACLKLKAPVFPKEIVEICNSAYNGCESITEVDVPPTVHEIGSSAFSQCVSLKKLILPCGLKRVGQYAFSGCIALEYIVMNRVFPGFETAFDDCDSINRIDTSNSSGLTAHILFPKADIYDLGGKLQFSAGGVEAIPTSEFGTLVKINSNTVNNAFEQYPGSKVIILPQTEYCFDADGQTIKVIFKGTNEINKIIKKYLRLKDTTTYQLYDAEELIKAVNSSAGELKTIEPRSGEWIKGLSETYEQAMHVFVERSKPLAKLEIEKRLAAFTRCVLACMIENNVCKILDIVSKDSKQDISNATVITKLNIADYYGNVVALLARYTTETELEIFTKMIYLGDSEYEKDEAIQVLLV